MTSSSLDRTSAPDAIRDLLAPRATLPADVDCALFGDSLSEIGLDPEAINIQEIQYRQIVAIYDALCNRVREGQARDMAPVVKYFLQQIGERLVVMLEKGRQSHERKSALLKPALLRRMTKEGRRYEKESKDHARIAEEFQRVNKCIAAARARLIRALKESFMFDNQSEEIREAYHLKSQVETFIQELEYYIDLGPYGNHTEIYGQTAALVNIASGPGAFAKRLKDLVISPVIGDDKIVSPDDNSISRFFYCRRDHLSTMLPGAQRLLSEIDLMLNKYTSKKMAEYFKPQEKAE